LPSVFLELDEQEKAFIVAAIQIKMENDRKKEKEIKRKSKKGRKGR
jgi:prophage tail gpP-like protein